MFARFSAARSVAPRHLVGKPRLRDIWRRPEFKWAAPCAVPGERGQKPQSGQERPPRRGRCAAPALTPRGVAPALVATPSTMSSRQTNRRTARGGLSTASGRRHLSVFARCRCLSDRSATEEMPQIARVAVLFGRQKRVKSRFQPADDVASMAANKPPGSLADLWATSHTYSREQSRRRLTREVDRQPFATCSGVICPGGGQPRVARHRFKSSTRSSTFGSARGSKDRRSAAAVAA